MASRPPVPGTPHSDDGTVCGDGHCSRGQMSLRRPPPSIQQPQSRGSGHGATSPLRRNPAAVAAGPAGTMRALRAAEGASSPSIAADMKALGRGVGGGLIIINDINITAMSAARIGWLGCPLSLLQPMGGPERGGAKPPRLRPVCRGRSPRARICSLIDLNNELVSGSPGAAHAQAHPALHTHAHTHTPRTAHAHAITHARPGTGSARPRRAPRPALPLRKSHLPRRSSNRRIPPLVSSV